MLREELRYGVNLGSDSQSQITDGKAKPSVRKDSIQVAMENSSQMKNIKQPQNPPQIKLQDSQPFHLDSQKAESLRKDSGSSRFSLNKTAAVNSPGLQAGMPPYSWNMYPSGLSRGPY
jgi:ribosomal protein L24E